MVVDWESLVKLHQSVVHTFELERVKQQRTERIKLFQNQALIAIESIESKNRILPAKCRQAYAVGVVVYSLILSYSFE